VQLVIRPSLTPARRPAGLDLEAIWIELRRRFDERGGAGLRVRALVRTEDVARFLRMSAGPTIEPVRQQEHVADPSWTEVGLRFRGEGPAVAFLLGFGGDVEVVEPPSMRAAMAAAARAITARYADA
jgi:predicted DNA-binding transcriptional regulator YafY